MLRLLQDGSDVGLAQLDPVPEDALLVALALEAEPAPVLGYLGARLGLMAILLAPEPVTAIQVARALGFLLVDLAHLGHEHRRNVVGLPPADCCALDHAGDLEVATPPEPCQAFQGPV